MARTCEICGKHPMSGKSITHAHNVNNRIFYPNLRTMKIEKNGINKKVKICMKCLKTMAKV